MKSAVLILLLFICNVICNGQPVFKKMFGYFSANNFELKEIGGSGKYIISNHNNEDGHHTFFKIDSSGEPYDQASISQHVGGSTWGSHNFYFNNNSIYDLIGINTIITTGVTYPLVGFICRRDSSLQNAILTKYYSYRPSGYGQTSTLNGDSTYTIAGGHAIAPGQYYPIIFKLDTGLNISWSRCYKDRVGYVQKIIQASDSGYFILMNLKNEGMVLAKTDPLGDIVWSKNYNNPMRIPQGMIFINDSTIYLLGYMNKTLLPSNYSSINPFIIKTDGSGNVIWSQSYGDPGYPIIHTVLNPCVFLDTATDNRLMMVSSVLHNGNIPCDMVLIILDENGDISWSRRYGNDFFDESGFIGHQTSDGGFILGCFNNYQINNFPPVQNMANVTIIKTDSLGVSDGCMEYPMTIYSEPDTPSVTNLAWSIYVDTLVTELPSNMLDTTGTPTRNENMCTFVSLMERDNPGNFVELFPNPTHGQFTITALSDMTMVTVYDITGRRVLEETLTGLLSYSINLEGQPAGLYLVQIAIGDKVVTRKIAVE